MNFIFSSCGNDSVALMQWVIENKPNDDNYLIYSDTGWAASFWPDRILKVKKYAESKGLKFIITKSEGMANLVQRKKGWPKPASNMQFCTDELKVKPAKEFMDKIDPDLSGVCYTGIRREESKNRETAPYFIEMSERHGGRDLYCPLVEIKEAERNELIEKTGIEILNHSSMECFPCVCSNRSDLLMLAKHPERVRYIEILELMMGYTRNNKPRVMFRPYRHQGAIGIRKVIDWALSGRGNYKKISDGQTSFDDDGLLKCNSGFCGF